jgi:hypothetical protein
LRLDELRIGVALISHLREKLIERRLRSVLAQNDAREKFISGEQRTRFRAALSKLVERACRVVGSDQVGAQEPSSIANRRFSFAASSPIATSHVVGETAASFHPGQTNDARLFASIFAWLPKNALSSASVASSILMRQ